jgi:hypothetical protein
MEWLWSPFTLIVIGYSAALVAWFASKLNRDRVVPTGHVTDGRIEAIEFFWRPG